MQQVELDTERHILTQTKRLSDGQTEKIFSRNARGLAGYFTYNCHLCGVPNLPGEKALQTHITGKKHQNRLVFSYVPEADTFRSFIVQSGKSQQTIFPGEPIPPGFEDEMKLVCHMDSIIAKIEKPLIGLEYVLELHDVKLKEPLYVCVLCDKRCDPRNIIPQITSHRHRMKYLENHFPKVMNVLNRQGRFNTDMSHREEVLTKLAAVIEDKAKRQRPSIYDYKKYEVNKKEISNEIKNAKHFDEADYPDFEKTISENVKTQELDDVSSSDSEFNNYRDSVKERKVSSFKFNDVRYDRSERGSRFPKNNKISVRSTVPIRNDPPPRSDQVRKILTPRELSEQANEKMQEKYRVEKYKASVNIGIEDIDKKYKEYNKNPEKHPLYSDEWKQFWSMRYRELVGLGKDANSHDYKPEWIQFWMKRMKQLQDDAKVAKKREIRRKLDLTADFVSKIDLESSPSRSPTPQTRRSRTRSPIRRHRHQSRSPIEISDESDSDNYSRSRFASKRPRYDDDRSRSRYSDSPISHRSLSNFRRSPSVDYNDPQEINLVSVCRLLSALESEVGMLANKVIDLLTKAVSMEKSKANSCDELLYDNDNMILMETVKEKLKGGVNAGLVVGHKVAPVKSAIQQIARLIHQVNVKKPKVELTKQPTATDANETARQEIAKVLTQSLIEQGRDDLTHEELEEMIDSLLQEGLETVKEEPPAVAVVEEAPIEPKKPEKDDNFAELENLTDDDLKTLLRNFSDLTSDEQNHLITYLSKIENADVKRVERLRKYVDIGDEEIESDVEDVEMEKPSTTAQKSPERPQILSDDEYEDTEIVKSMNEQLGSEQKTVVTSLANTGVVANDLMNSLMTSFMQTSSWDQQPQQQQQQPKETMWDMQHAENSMQSYMMMQPTNYYDPSMSMPIMAGNMQWQQPMQEIPMMNQYPPPNSSVSDRQSYRKRMDRPNNMQLTGRNRR